MLDVGASNVEITCGIAARHRPDLRLIAFEPVPLNVKVLTRIRRLCRIKSMDIHSVAVGDAQCSIAIAIPSINGRTAHNLCHVISEEFSNPDVERLPFTTVEVPMRSLDSFEFDRVDAIKIDVEDHEYHVLKGAQALFRQFRPVVFCELWDTPNRAKSMQFMQSLGYSIVRHDELGFIFTHG